MNREAAIRLSTGDLLFAAGDPADVGYMIESGEVEVWIETGGQRRSIAILKSGDLVGEMAILDAGRRSANVSALTDCTLLAISRQLFERRLAEADPILRLVVDVVLNRLRGMLHAGASAATPDNKAERAAVLSQLRLESELGAAIVNGELRLFYQPIVDLASGRLAGYEALVRWQHPIRGMIPPGDFIPAAEASGMITELTRWALITASLDMARIDDVALGNPNISDAPFMSVNISGRDLMKQGFSAWIADLVRERGIDCSALKLEVTESMVMREPEKAITALTEMRALGIGVSIDDFGTGHSSLAYLTRFPLNTLKIDRSFVTEVAADEAKARVIRAVLGLAATLGVSTVAEGIETDLDRIALTEFGTRFGQGYLFGKPAPLDVALTGAKNWDRFRWAHHVGDDLGTRGANRKAKGGRAVRAAAE